MTPGDLASLLTAGAALLAAGGWLANIGLRQAERRKILAEARSEDAEADHSSAASAATLFGMAGKIIDTLREEAARNLELRNRFETRMTEMEAHLTTIATQERDCQRRLSAALDRIERLESTQGAHP